MCIEGGGVRWCVGWDWLCSIVIVRELKQEYMLFACGVGDDAAVVLFYGRVLVNPYPSQVTFCLPVAIILRFNLVWNIILFYLVVSGITYLIPPKGWKRPHPYSDFEENRSSKRND